MGPRNLWGGDAEQVDVQLDYVEGKLAGRLDGVGVEGHPAAELSSALLDGRGDGGDGLDRPDLVVGEHDADEDRFAADRTGDLVRVDEALRVNLEAGDLEAEALQVFERVEDGVVFHGGGDDVCAGARVLLGEGDPFEGGVDRLGAATTEDQLAGTGVEDLGDFVAGGVERVRGVAPESVKGGGVAEGAVEERRHRFGDLRVDRGRRRVIDVNQVIRHSYLRA